MPGGTRPPKPYRARPSVRQKQFGHPRVPKIRFVSTSLHRLFVTRKKVGRFGSHALLVQPKSSLFRKGPSVAQAGVDSLGNGPKIDVEQREG